MTNIPLLILDCEVCQDTLRAMLQNPEPRRTLRGPAVHSMVRRITDLQYFPTLSVLLKARAAYEQESTDDNLQACKHIASMLLPHIEELEVCLTGADMSQTHPLRPSILHTLQQPLDLSRAVSLPYADYSADTASMKCARSVRQAMEECTSLFGMEITRDTPKLNKHMLDHPEWLISQALASKQAIRARAAISTIGAGRNSAQAYEIVSICTRLETNTVRTYYHRHKRELQTPSRAR